VRRARPLFAFPLTGPAKPVFVGSPWRATVVRWVTRIVVAAVALIMGLLVTGLAVSSGPGPGSEPVEAPPVPAAADVR
jgi:hypothetical protein